MWRIKQCLRADSVAGERKNKRPFKSRTSTDLLHLSCSPSLSVCQQQPFFSSITVLFKRSKGPIPHPPAERTRQTFCDFMHAERDGHSLCFQGGGSSSLVKKHQQSDLDTRLQNFMSTFWCSSKMSKHCYWSVKSLCEELLLTGTHGAVFAAEVMHHHSIRIPGKRTERHKQRSTHKCLNQSEKRGEYK